MKRQPLKSSVRTICRTASYLAVIVSCFVLLAGCGNTMAGSAPVTAANVESGVSGVTGATGSTGNTTTITTTQDPLQFQVTGMGNHPQYVCIPAQTRLWLRIIPNQNETPLFQAWFLDWTFSNGDPIYEGEPAAYSQLRVRLTIPNTSANYDFSSSVNQPSVEGDYSSFLSTHASQVVNMNTNSNNLSTPEYTDEWILGSTPYDGKCTYWEQYFGKCSAVSSSLEAANTATCGAGQVKILINTIISDYPCNDSYITSELNWCAGSSTQIVTDYQQWSLTLEAVTENTTTNGF